MFRFPFYVVLTLKRKRNEVFSILIELVSKTGFIITRDSRSDLAKRILKKSDVVEIVDEVKRKKRHVIIDFMIPRY